MERSAAIALGLFGYGRKYAKIGNAKNVRGYKFLASTYPLAHDSYEKSFVLFYSGELENFLCIVQHDRKFFLTETANVLKQSIMKNEDFTAYKALIGFEAISLYASNLFRKPWRKEYRCIKVIVR